MSRLLCGSTLEDSRTVRFQSSVHEASRLSVPRVCDKFLTADAPNLTLSFESVSCVVQQSFLPASESQFSVQVMVPTLCLPTWTNLMWFSQAIDSISSRAVTQVSTSGHSSLPADAAVHFLKVLRNSSQFHRNRTVTQTRNKNKIQIYILAKHCFCDYKFINNDIICVCNLLIQSFLKHNRRSPNLKFYLVRCNWVIVE